MSSLIFLKVGDRSPAGWPQIFDRNITNGTPEEFAGEGTVTASSNSGFQRSFQEVGTALTFWVL